MRPLSVLVAAAGQDTDYAALGDSAAAGPLVLPMDLSQPGCHRSEVNYPSLDVHSLDDLTCDGADFDGVHHPESTDFGDVRRKGEAVTAATDLVTLHVGANEIGLVGAAMDCINLLPQPFGDSCTAEQTAGGVDRLKAKIDATAPELVAIVQAVRSRRAPSSSATPPTCRPTVATRWCRTLDSLNAMLRTTALANGAGYVDLAAASVGHDMCKNPGVRWVEPLIPGSIAAPLHPNNIGMVGFAQAVVATVQ